MKSSLITIVIFFVSTFFKGNLGYYLGCTQFAKLTSSFYLTFVGDPANETPVYNKNGKTFVFKHDKDFENFLKMAEESLLTFHESRAIDTILPLIGFYKQYNEKLVENKNLSLADFFKTYKQPIPKYAESSTVSYAVSFLKALTFDLKENYNLEDYVYLVAVKENVPKSYLEKGNLKKVTESFMSDSSFMTTTYGALQFKIADGERFGYMLFDRYETPVILMQDGQKPHSAKVELLREKIRKTYKLVDFDTRYAICSNQKDNDTYYDIIFFDKPFCSFDEITHRYSLLKNEHFKCRTFGNGGERNVFSFDLQSKEKKVVMKTIDEKGNPGIYCEFDTTKPNKQEFQAWHIMISQQADILRTDVTKLQNTLSEVTQIINDEKFKTELQQLYDSKIAVKPIS